MTTFCIDSNRQQLRATGIVEPVMQWIDDPTTGRRKQSDHQELNENGVPKWSVEVQYVGMSYGKAATVIARVNVGSATQPALAMFEVVNFENLQVSVSVNKTGVMRESWFADGIVAAATRSNRNAEAA